MARSVGIGITTPSALKRSAFRKQIRVLTVPEFDNGMGVWLVHAPGLASGRLATPLLRFRSSLADILREQGIASGAAVTGLP